MKVLRKYLRRLLMIISYVIILNILSVLRVHATTEINYKEVDNRCIYTYEVQEKEESSFLSSLEKEKTIDNLKATLIDTQKTGGSTTMNTIRTVEKSFISNTNDTSEILSNISNTIDYSENGYTGILNFDTTSLKVDEIKGQSHEYKVSITRTYNNYSRNDLDTIPKTISQNGITYYLVNPTWKVTSTEVIDNQEVPETYSAIMNYEGIATRTDPSTYEVHYAYSGNVEKVDEKPLIYTVTYEKETKFNFIPAVLTSGGIFFCAIFLILSRKHITLYNKQNNGFKKIRKINIKNSSIKLDKYKHLYTSKEFKLEFDKKYFEKYKNSNIDIVYDNETKNTEIIRNSVIVRF